MVMTCDHHYWQRGVMSFSLFGTYFNTPKQIPSKASRMWDRRGEYWVRVCSNSGSGFRTCKIDYGAPPPKGVRYSNVNTWIMLVFIFTFISPCMTRENSIPISWKGPSCPTALSPVKNDSHSFNPSKGHLNNSLFHSFKLHLFHFLDRRPIVGRPVYRQVFPVFSPPRQVGLTRTSANLPPPLPSSP